MKKWITAYWTWYWWKGPGLTVQCGICGKIVLSFHLWRLKYYPQNWLRTR